MAPAKRPSKLLGLVKELDIDEISSTSLVSFAPSESNMMPVKRGRGRPPANKVVKPAQRAAPHRVIDGHPATSRRSPRGVLDEKSTNEELQKPQRGRKHAEENGSQSRGRESRTIVNDHDNDVDNTSGVAGSPEIPETQSPMPEGDDLATGDVAMRDLPQTASLSFRAPSSSSKRSAVPRETDSQLRRRIGDLSKRCEAWEAKYRDLREMGVKEAEVNFDRLKKEADQRTNTANSLISQLQNDLAAERILAQEGQLHQQHLATSEAKVSELSASLAEARKELVSLAAKLRATRVTEVPTSGLTAPGSAVKGANAAARAAAAASSEALQMAQLKEDIYGDLTGLIVRGVKREPACEAFDCIQTGRNGTLHFKLIVNKDDVSESSYEETQFTFEPQLDDNRDRDLVEFLPDYMTDEITFPRAHATRFFLRLTRALEEHP